MKKSLGARAMPMPAPVWVVGTYDSSGKANIMTAAWAGICCSRPPCLYVSLRKATYSYSNIAERKAFSVNVPSQQFVRETDFAGIVSGRDVDKFSQANLTTLHAETVDAPCIQEFPVIYECALLHTIEIGLHTQFIGEIMDIKIDESMLNDSGKPDIDRLNLFVYTGDYYAVGKMVAKAFSIGNELKPPPEST
jgi:flavin reductase (DIM6/NTAB) family NADH-FMN oxidoreductase RutF